MKNAFYITTPIYYPSNKLHIGHAYCTTIADSIARYKRLTGHEVFFLTGSDENGQKLVRSAEAAGMSTLDYIDKIVASFKELWQILNVSYDDFIRTTEQRHIDVVQNFFRKLRDNGDIYKGKYAGLYCTDCESYWLERDLDEHGHCPDCHRPVEAIEEDAYFFKLSKYADRLLKYIEDNPEFIVPVTRRNEVTSFIKQGLEDLCVSRKAAGWGIPVPDDEDHVIYVWFDALINYLVPLINDPARFEKFWPHVTHLVGKEITRFHCIIWPSMLMSAEMPLPQQVIGHGWLITSEGKMSKSKGNVIDPVGLIKEFSADAIRYFLLREIVLGQDGTFSRDALINRINADLANDLGNLLHRTLNMIGKFQHGTLKTTQDFVEGRSLKADALATVSDYRTMMDKNDLSNAIKRVWTFISRANKFIDETMPWKLAKDQSKAQELNDVLYNLAESLRIIAIMISPFMPITARRIYDQLQLDNFDSIQLDDADRFGKIANDHSVGKPQQLFPRIIIETK